MTNPQEAVYSGIMKAFWTIVLIGAAVAVWAVVFAQSAAE